MCPSASRSALMTELGMRFVGIPGRAEGRASGADRLGRDVESGVAVPKVPLPLPERS